MILEKNLTCLVFYNHRYVIELQLLFLFANSFSLRERICNILKASDYVATKYAWYVIIKNVYMANRPLRF